MSKRLTSTGKWRDPWFCRLSLQAKLVFLYVADACDPAGVWAPDFAAAEAEIGFAQEGVNPQWHRIMGELGAGVELGAAQPDEPTPAIPARRVLPVRGGKWWVVNYCRFQYGVLRAGFPRHAPALRSLKAHGLWETYCQLFPDGLTPEARANGPAATPFPKARPLPVQEDIRLWPEARGIAENDLQLFFHHYTALGWRQPNGRRYRDFRALLSRWRALGRPAAPDGFELACLHTRLVRIEQRIEELKRLRYQPHPGALPQIQPEALAELARLQREQSDLETRIIHGHRNIPNHQIQTPPL